METIRFAIIGTSSITRLLLQAAAGCPEFELAGVYSRTMEQAKAFGREYGARYFYNDLEVLAADSRIDAVYIASPNGLHYEQTMQMVKAGKHVLCEKAMGANAREAQELFTAARQHGVILLEALRSIYNPGLSLIKDNLKKLGTVRHVNFHFGKYSSKYDDFKAGENCNIFNRAMAAGGLMDIGIYCVEPLIELFGAPKTVQAHAVLLENSIDGAGAILADYETMIAALSYSKIANLMLPSQIAGEEATMLIPQITMPGDIDIVYRDGSREHLDAELCENNMVYELQFFMDAIRQNMDVSKYQELTLTSLTLMDEVRKQMGVRFPADENR